MNIIVVPTDFSPSADNAMKYAAELAQTVNASLLLVHVYQIPVSMSDVPVLMISAEELKVNADKGLERVRELLQKNYPSLDIKTDSRLGDVVEEIKAVCAEISPLLLVVGKHGASGMERLLFGSTTLSIIRHTAYPLIAVPDAISQFRLNRAALAADILGIGPQQDFIEQFMSNVNAQLHIIHVHESGKESPGLKNLLPHLNPVHKTIRNEEFVHGIERYVKSNNIDLLIILPHKHSVIERLFFKTHTTELIQKIQIPILCIPEN